LPQARALITFLDAASEKTLRSTVALTASRGRGKARALLHLSASLLLLQEAYADVFITYKHPIIMQASKHTQ
jgi:N-acetyltransferase 10